MELDISPGKVIFFKRQGKNESAGHIFMAKTGNSLKTETVIITGIPHQDAALAAKHL